MAITPVENLKQRFKKGMYPTEDDFANVFDSYVHKSDGIDIGNVSSENGTKTLSETLQDLKDEAVGEAVTTARDEASNDVDTKLAGYATSAAVAAIGTRVTTLENAEPATYTAGEGISISDSNVISTNIPIQSSNSIEIAATLCNKINGLYLLTKDMKSYSKGHIYKLDEGDDIGVLLTPGEGTMVYTIPDKYVKMLGLNSNKMYITAQHEEYYPMLSLSIGYMNSWATDSATGDHLLGFGGGPGLVERSIVKAMMGGRVILNDGTVDRDLNGSISVEDIDDWQYYNEDMAKLVFVEGMPPCAYVDVWGTICIGILNSNTGRFNCLNLGATDDNLVELEEETIVTIKGNPTITDISGELIGSLAGNSFIKRIDDLDESDAPAGTIALYGGDTTSQYTHGRFYEKVAGVGSDYIWQPLDA